jgi:hypothetical protein
MTLSRLSRLLICLAALVAAFQILGFLLFSSGGSQPPMRGHGDPVGYSQQS